MYVPAPAQVTKKKKQTETAIHVWDLVASTHGFYSVRSLKFAENYKGDYEIYFHNKIKDYYYFEIFVSSHCFKKK